jgi:hypothetical protein
MYVNYWKDHIQQGGNQGNLRTFKINFEKYTSEISNVI